MFVSVRRLQLTVQPHQIILFQILPLSVRMQQNLRFLGWDGHCTGGLIFLTHSVTAPLYWQRFSFF